MLASFAVAAGCLAREGRGHPTPRCERCPWKEGFCGPAWVRGCGLPRPPLPVTVPVSCLGAPRGDPPDSWDSWGDVLGTSAH